MNISRKDFIKKSTLLSGGLILLPVIGNFAGCTAGQETTRVSDNDCLIEYNNLGRLENPGDSELIEIGTTTSKIILIRLEGLKFAALNPVCTHKGCELVKRKEFLDCPCHGSEFDFSGKVLKGPASEPLQSFRTEFDGKNTVTIFLR